MSRLERHHGIGVPSDLPAPVRPLHRAQLRQDPDEPVISSAAATPDIALPAEGRHKLMDKPVHTSAQAQTADPTSLSTVDLIKNLQKRSNEVLSYLNNSQKAAAD